MPSGVFAGGFAEGFTSGFKTVQGAKQRNRKLTNQEQQAERERMVELVQGIKDHLEENLKQANEAIKASDANGLPRDNEQLQGTLKLLKANTLPLMQRLNKLSGGQVDPQQMLNRFQQIETQPTPEVVAARKTELKAKEAGAVEAAKIAERPQKLSRFGAFSPSTGKRFTAFDDGQGGIQMLQDGKLVDAPDDVIPVSSQITGTSAEVLSKTEQRNLRGELSEAETSIDDISFALKGAIETPGASGIRGFLSEKLGGAIGQLPGGESLEKSFTRLVSDADPEEVSAVRTRAQTLVAKMLSEITGEESGRFTKEEQLITKTTLKQLDPNASMAQITSAMKVVMEISVDDMLRSSGRLGKPKFDLSKNQDIQKFGDFLIDIGFNEKEAISIVAERRKRQKRK